MFKPTLYKAEVSKGEKTRNRYNFIICSKTQTVRIILQKLHSSSLLKRCTACLTLCTLMDFDSLRIGLSILHFCWSKLESLIMVYFSPRRFEYSANPDEMQRFVWVFNLKGYQYTKG